MEALEALGGWSVVPDNFMLKVRGMRPGGSELRPMQPYLNKLPAELVDVLARPFAGFLRRLALRPEIGGGFKGVDPHLVPEGGLIACLVEFVVMGTTEWDGELVADLSRTVVQHVEHSETAESRRAWDDDDFA